MISGLNEQLQQQLEYTLLKPDCHSWWLSKMQSDKISTGLYLTVLDVYKSGLSDIYVLTGFGIK